MRVNRTRLRPLGEANETSTTLSLALWVVDAFSGDPVVPDRTYTVATNDYLLHARREFPTLTRTHEVRTLDVQYEVLAAYAREHGIDPRVEGRIALESESD